MKFRNIVIVSICMFILTNCNICIAQTNSTSISTISEKITTQKTTEVTETHSSTHISATTSSVVTSEEKKSTSQPKIILYNYKLTPEIPTAGENFYLEVSLKNTNKKQNVQNVRINLKSEEAYVVPHANYSTQYIPAISANNSKTIKFILKSRNDIKPLPQKLVIDIDYEDTEGNEFKTSSDIYVEIKQEAKLDFDKPLIPNSLNAGDSVSISMNVYNSGKGTLYNVICQMDVPGLSTEGNCYLGNMESGTQLTADFSVFVNMKEIQGASPELYSNKYGNVAGKITIKFEDEFSEKYTKEIEISTEITPPVISSFSNNEEEQPKVFQWWVSVCVGITIIVSLIIYIIVLKNKKKLVDNYEND